MISLDRFATLYRSSLFQIVIVGLVAFCEPGIWTALNNLGAGGNAKVSSYDRHLNTTTHTFPSHTSTMPRTRSRTA
jgi:hypothetical protein